MLEIIKTDSQDNDFLTLVGLLDADLNARYGEMQAQYDGLNRLDPIRHVIVLYVDGHPAACGAFKEYAPGTAEIKRVFVDKPHRGRGLSKAVMAALEEWAVEEGYTRAILETGSRQHEAISLYQRIGYRIIPNYPPYVGNENSVCMQKKL